MKLKKLEVGSFGGINPASPLVIDFNNGGFVTLKGDAGVGKTSLINALLLACGALGAPDTEGNKKFINNQSGKVDINFSFVGNDRYEYHVRCTKSSFSLTYEGENIPSPMTKMKELLGVVGISPMEIKNKPLKDIVKWLAGYTTKNVEEFEKQMDKHKTNAKASATGRADANRAAKGLREYLNNEDLFLNWEKSEKKYAAKIDIKKLADKLDVAGKNSDAYIKAEAILKNLKDNRPSVVNEIEYFKLKLAEKEKELLNLDKRIVSGQEYIDKNKAVKKEYDTVKAEYDSSHEYVQNYNKWQDIKKKKTELDEFETASQKADANEKAALAKIKELQSEILPDIKGVSIVSEDGHVDGVMVKEGLYIGKQSAAQVSETEWNDFVFQVFDKNKVRVIILDNVQSLGSKGYERLQKLHNKGAYIFAAEMNRGKNELEVVQE